MQASSFEIVFFMFWNRYFDFMKKSQYIIYRIKGEKGHEKSVIRPRSVTGKIYDFMIFHEKLKPPEELALFSEFQLDPTSVTSY